MDYNREYDRYQEIALKGLERQFALYRDVPEPLFSAMRYSVEAGGKRLRPVLMLASGEMLGGDTGNILPFASAIEIIHTYSLIHDDMPCMDNDSLRRGKPTNHTVFGEGMAMLAGDGLLNMAYEILIGHIKACPSAYNINAAFEIAKAAGSLGMVAGQCADITCGNNPKVSEKDLYYIHAHKTGKIISAAAVAGAYAANASQNDVANMEKFGSELGMLFQITDDILDVTGTPESLGKSAGKDTEQNKLTYPKIFGLEKSYALAEEHYDNIIEILSPYGRKADFLSELSLKMLKRNK